MQPFFSIVVAYRNREPVKVSRFLDSINAQSFQDFELIFVDSGSEPRISDEVAGLCHKFSFCRYLFSDTRDMIWCKANTLNIGVRAARGKYFIGTDVDLILSKDILCHLHSLCSPDTQIFCRALKLPESFTDFDSLNACPTHFELFNFTAYGLLHCFEMQWFDKVTGFDEYYRLWGFEDRDMAERLAALGLESIWLNETKYPIYHQWHPSGRIQLFMQWHWGDMCMHYANSKLIQNIVFSGNIISSEFRPLNQFHKCIDFSTSRYLNKFTYRELVKEIMHALLTQRETAINLDVINPPHTKTALEGETKKGFSLTDTLVSPFQRKSVKKTKATEDCDICYFLYELLFKSALLIDHRCTESAEKIAFTLLAGNTVYTQPTA